MSMKNSYFEIPSPFAMIERWLNPQSYQRKLELRGKPLTVSWTKRADRALAQRGQPLLAEMQLYFSCVVKKRVLFHEATLGDEVETLAVNDQLHVAFRPVEANSCDPVEFAKNYPVKRSFESKGASKMHPKSISVDFKKGRWIGEFTI